MLQKGVLQKGTAEIPTDEKGGGGEMVTRKEDVIREKLRELHAVFSNVDIERIARERPDVARAMMLLSKSIARHTKLKKPKSARCGGLGRRTGDARELHQFSSCVRLAGDRTRGRMVRSQSLRRSLDLLDQAMVSTFGNTILIQQGGRTTDRIVVHGEFEHQHFSGPVERDDGRGALLFRIKESLKACGKILSDAEFEIIFHPGTAEKKRLTLRAMVELMKEVASRLASDVIEYAKFEDADDYDETILTEGVRTLCTAVYKTGSREQNACLGLIDDLRGELGRGTDLRKSELVEGVPPALHRLAEWFLPSKREKKPQIADLKGFFKKELAAAVVECKGQVSAVGNRILRRFDAGTHERRERDGRPPEERALLDEVNRRLLKQDEAEAEARKSHKPFYRLSKRSICQNVYDEAIEKGLPMPFKSAEQLRTCYYNDEHNIYP